MSSLLQALQGASAEEVAAALLQLSETRYGFACDVRMALYEAGAGKDVPGPDPYDQNPKSLGSGSVCVSGFDPHREAEAVEAFREIWGHKIPTFDETDPKWLKATRAERKVAKRKAEDWAKYPNRDQVPGFSQALRSRKAGMSISRPSFFDGAPRPAPRRKRRLPGSPPTECGPTSKATRLLLLRTGYPSVISLEDPADESRHRTRHRPDL